MIAGAPSMTVVLVAATLSQVASAMGIAIFPVLAPQLALMLGVDASVVGYQISILFGAALLASSAVGTIVLRWGACRSMQWACWLAAMGMAAALPGELWLMPLAAAFIGASNALAAAGAAHLLFRFGEARNRNLVYSIKQAGVPLGWAAIALVAPLLTVVFSWRAPMALVLVYSAACALWLGQFRAWWDDDRDPGAASKTSVFTGMQVLWRYPTLRYLSIAAFFFSFVQLCLGSFTVNLLVQEVGYSLVAAGVMLSLVQASGMCGRMVFGWVADRVGNAVAVLLFTNLLAGLCCALVLLLPLGWPVAVLALFYIVFGLVAYGWNGIMHAQVARLSPQGMVSVVTGGMMMWVFAGILAGPSLFATAYRITGSYVTTYGGVALVALTGAVVVWVARRSVMTQAAAA
ncbi:MAG: MFS transporter [Burkholderiales bacterium]